jgi:hypothetical protein
MLSWHKVVVSIDINSCWSWSLWKSGKCHKYRAFDETLSRREFIADALQTSFDSSTQQRLRQMFHRTVQQNNRKRERGNNTRYRSTRCPLFSNHYERCFTWHSIGKANLISRLFHSFFESLTSIHEIAMNTKRDWPNMLSFTHVSIACLSRIGIKWEKNLREVTLVQRSWTQTTTIQSVTTLDVGCKLVKGLTSLLRDGKLLCLFSQDFVIPPHFGDVSLDSRTEEKYRTQFSEGRLSLMHQSVKLIKLIETSSLQ